MDGKAVITTGKKRGGRDVDTGGTSEIVTIPGRTGRDDMTDKAMIRYAAGATLNMGNYESARIDVELTVPCKLELEAMQKGYEWAKSWVQRRLEAEIENTKTD